MFTIKLYSDENHYNVLECPHYSISEFIEVLSSSESSVEKGKVVELTLYSDFTTQKGITYRIAADMETPHWKYVFIENSAGKTIDHIRPQGGKKFVPRLQMTTDSSHYISKMVNKDFLGTFV